MHNNKNSQNRISPFAFFAAKAQRAQRPVGNSVLSILISGLFLLASCAQILTPNGGDKDIEPPFVVKYLPDSAATDFAGKRIVLRFNEYVQLNDIHNQLVVSPPLKQDPEVNIHKREVVITIKDTLLPNTTYSLSFGSSIKDITEGNVLDNFRYVFSTGPVIDSLQLSGKVLDASSLGGKSGMLVMLYNVNEDTAPYIRRPYYFTKTKADGSFLITNIRAGSYKVFALADKNQNYLYDKPDEEIAFADVPVTLNANIDTLRLRSFIEGPKGQKALKAEGTKKHIRLVYAQPISDLRVPLKLTSDEQAGYLLEHSANNDTIDLWFSKLDRDSIRIPVYSGNTRIDSASIRFQKQMKTSRGSGGDLAKPVLTSNIPAKNFDPARSLEIHSDNPVKSFDPKFIIIRHGNDTVKNDISILRNHDLHFNYTFESDSTYSMLILPGAVTDWFGKTNDTLKQSFKVESMDNFATIKVKVNGIASGKYIVQLIDDKAVIVSTKYIDGGTDLSFEHLLAGNYHLKMIVDANNNNRWDTGNYPAKLQPERVLLYSSPIKLRSGWDMEIEWNF